MSKTETLSSAEYRSLVAKKPGKKRSASKTKITPYNVKMYVENELGITLVSEYKFHPVRRWKFDLCQPDLKIAIEIEGGVWANDGQGGRHNRGSGYIADLVKYNTATAMGYRLFRIATGGSLAELTGYIKQIL